MLEMVSKTMVVISCSMLHQAAMFFPAGRCR
jgi:hypothetical protein